MLLELKVLMTMMKHQKKSSLINHRNNKSIPLKRMISMRSPKYRKFSNHLSRKAVSPGRKIRKVKRSTAIRNKKKIK